MLAAETDTEADAAPIGAAHLDLARDLRRRIAADDEAYLRAVDAISQPVIERLRRHPGRSLRPAMLADFVQQWISTEHRLYRLDLHAKLERVRATLTERRLSAGKVRCVSPHRPDDAAEGMTNTRGETPTRGERLSSQRGQDASRRLPGPGTFLPETWPPRFAGAVFSLVARHSKAGVRSPDNSAKPVRSLIGCARYVLPSAPRALRPERPVGATGEASAEAQSRHRGPPPGLEAIADPIARHRCTVGRVYSSVGSSGIEARVIRVRRHRPQPSVGLLRSYANHDATERVRIGKNFRTMSEPESFRSAAPR